MLLNACIGIAGTSAVATEPSFAAEPVSPWVGSFGVVFVAMAPMLAGLNLPCRAVGGAPTSQFRRSMQVSSTSLSATTSLVGEFSGAAPCSPKKLDVKRGQLGEAGLSAARVAGSR